VPIDDCPAGRPELRAWLAAIIADPPPLVRASLRLRVGLDGTRGLWLDADRAALAAVTQADSGLGAWAARMVAAGVVLEVGQRQEAVARGASGGLERVLATRRAWSNTWVGRNPWPLLTRLSDFAQPSPEGNRALLDAVLEAVQATGERRWLELGAGAGNMTLPLLAAGYVVRAVELDVAALGENLAAARAIPPRRLDAAGRALIAGLDGCEPRVGSLDRGREVAGWLIGEPRARGAAGEPIRAVLADPPRSGLGAFGEALGGLSRTLRPRVIVYVSCWHTALVRDARLLELQGYRLANARGVEQFRDSPEVEWVTVWRDARA
jgi:23S rRNA (uracil1939-C5)-methyltransferase